VVVVWIEAEGESLLTPAEQHIWLHIPSFLEEVFLAAHNRPFLQWSPMFLNNQDMEQANQSILGHSGPTDVITLTLSNRPWIIESYIGIETIRSQAAVWGVTPEEELLRILFHSLLHGLGYDDATRQQHRQMYALETEWIGQFERWMKEHKSKHYSHGE